MKDTFEVDRRCIKAGMNKQYRTILWGVLGILPALTVQHILGMRDSSFYRWINGKSERLHSRSLPTLYKQIAALLKTDEYKVLSKIQEILQYEKKHRNISKISRALDTNWNTVTNWLTGESSPSAAFVPALTKLFKDHPVLQGEVT